MAHEKFSIEKISVDFVGYWEGYLQFRLLYTYDNYEYEEFKAFYNIENGEVNPIHYLNDDIPYSGKLEKYGNIVYQTYLYMNSNDFLRSIRKASHKFFYDAVEIIRPS